MIHHQHYFPVVDDDGSAEAGVSRRHQHAAGDSRSHRAQLRARADGAAARRALLLGRGSQGDARVAHRPARRRSCSTRSSAATARRPSASRRWPSGLPREAFRRSRPRGRTRRRRRGWRRPIWRPTWCASSPSCRATMGGIYAREDGQPEAGVEGDLLPLPARRRRSRRAADRGSSSAPAAVTWAAVSLADKLDSVVGHVRGRRTADRLARSARSAASGAGCREDSGRSAGADRGRRRAIDSLRRS